MRNKHIFIIILVIGIFFRLYNLGIPVLDVDEAEIVLASKNILESGVPKGFYRVPFYENAYYYESNSSMYEFDSTNYYKTDLVLRKGWTTYYITAFFSLFGKSLALIIRGHGAVTVGESVEAACINAVSLEKTAEMQFMAAMLLLSPAIKPDFKTAKLFDPKTKEVQARVHKRYWDYYTSKLGRYLPESGKA